jgi:hypothetical protein
MEFARWSALQTIAPEPLPLSLRVVPTIPHNAGMSDEAKKVGACAAGIHVWNDHGDHSECVSCGAITGGRT